MPFKHLKISSRVWLNKAISFVDHILHPERQNAHLQFSGIARKQSRRSWDVISLYSCIGRPYTHRKLDTEAAVGILVGIWVEFEKLNPGQKFLRVMLQNYPAQCSSKPAIPHRRFLWPSLLGQIGSAKQRACNRDVRHFWQGAPTLPRPHVIHKHDGLAVIFLHLQHKRRELEEENESRE